MPQDIPAASQAQTSIMSKHTPSNPIIKWAASAKIRDWLLKFPLTRSFARRQAQELFDLCSGFVYTQVLFTFVDLRLHQHLYERTLSTTEVANTCGLPIESAERLLRAASSLGLATQGRDGSFGLGLKGAALIDNPGVIAMILHHAKFYRDLADPVALLRGEIEETEINHYWSYLRSDRAQSMRQETTNEYSDLMAVSQIMIAELVTASFDFRPFKRIMDVGGGTGTFLSHVAKVAPESTLTIFDLPQVAIAANERLSASGLAHRVTAVGGDFLKEDLPKDQDLITLVRVAYDHPDDFVLTVLKAMRRALAPSGRVLIAEPMASAKSDERTPDAYFNLYLTAMQSGKVRTAEEHSALLRQAGFTRIETRPTINPALAKMIVARP